MTSLWTELLSTLPERRIVPENGGTGARAALALAVPEEPMADDALFDHLRALAFDWAAYCGHPRFMAYITGAGTVPGAAADLLAALNMNLGGWRLSPGATEIERCLIRWLVSTFGLPSGAGGLLVSGGAMANFTALKAARDRQLGRRCAAPACGSAGPRRRLRQQRGPRHDRPAPWTCSASAPTRSVRIPVDDDFRLRMDALREAVRADQEDGVGPPWWSPRPGPWRRAPSTRSPRSPSCARSEGLWMHVDAAYGGPAVISDALRPLLRGIERADSVAFDPHKWMYTPHSGGCCWSATSGCSRTAFDAEASYVHEDQERVEHEVDFARSVRSSAAASRR